MTAGEEKQKQNAERFITVNTRIFKQSQEETKRQDSNLRDQERFTRTQKAFSPLNYALYLSFQIVKEKVKYEY